MNQLWQGLLRVLDLLSAVSSKLTGESPGVQDRHFWLPE